jgi:hypothetical protein
VSRERFVGLGPCSAAHEDGFVPAGCATDDVDVGARDAEKLREETFDLGVGLAAYGRRRDLEFDGAFAVEAFDRGALRAGRDVDVEEGSLAVLTKRLLTPAQKAAGAEDAALPLALFG